MSRSLLVVICDFLLLSMLSMVSFEGAETKTDDAQQTAQSLEQNFVDSQLVDLLKMSLDKERDCPARGRAGGFGKKQARAANRNGANCKKKQRLGSQS